MIHLEIRALWSSLCLLPISVSQTWSPCSAFTSYRTKQVRKWLTMKNGLWFRIGQGSDGVKELRVLISEKGKSGKGPMGLHSADDEGGWRICLEILGQNLQTHELELREKINDLKQPLANSHNFVDSLVVRLCQPKCKLYCPGLHVLFGSSCWY